MDLEGDGRSNLARLASRQSNEIEPASGSDLEPPRLMSVGDQLFIDS